MASRDLLPVSLTDRMNANVGMYDQWRRDDGGRIAKPLAADAVYDQQKARFVATPDESLLRTAIQKYIEERQNSNLNFAIHQAGWDPVLDALDDAKSIYEAKASRNPLRRPFRSPVAMENLKTLLECLPDEKGLSLIKIGLFVVFNAIRRRSEACEAVYKCFASIPDILRESEDIMEAARGDDTLTSAFNDLMNQLTESLPWLIDFLLRTEDGNVFTKTAKTVFGDPGARVTKEMEAIRILSERLKRHADHLERKRRQDDRRTAKSTHAEVASIRKNQFDASMSIRELKEAGEQRDKALLDQMRDMTKTFQQRQAHDHDIAMAAMQAREDKARISALITDLHMLIADYDRRSLLQAANAKPLLAGPQYSSQDMVEAVCAQDDPFIYQSDLSNVIRQYSKTSESDIAQAAFMVTTPRFRNWHMSDSSDLLLVEAHCADYTTGHMSPMSIFCAMFVSSRMQAAQASQGVSSENNILLWVFCSERMDLGGSFAGPTGLVRSLIVQLLVSWPKTAPQPHVHDLERIPNLWLDVKQHNISALCQLFHELLQQLPPTCKVVCIIDGVSCYETEAWGWESGLLMLIQCLRDCVYDMQRARYRAILKVLLTSPVKSISVVHMIEEAHQLDLRGGETYSGIQDFESMMVAARGPGF